MNIKRNLLWLAMFSASLAAANTLAQDSFDEFGFAEEAPARKDYNNYIELGLGLTHGTSDKFGEFNDPLQGRNNFGVGAIQLSDKEGLNSWLFSAGTGLIGNWLTAELNAQGNYNITLRYRESEKSEYGDVISTYANGSNNLNLAGPAGEKDFAVKRGSWQLETTKHLNANWAVSLDYSSQEKTGDKAFGAGQGFHGLNLVPEEVDYRHNESTLTFDYQKDNLSASFSYYYSDFENRESTMTFDNSWDADPAPAGPGLEQAALAPDNTFERWSFDGSWQLGYTTQLSWIVSQSTAEQDDDLLPYDIDNTGFYNLFGPPAGFTPLPTESLDGDVQREHYRLTLTSRPMRNFNYKVEYELKDRDTDHDAYTMDFVLYNGLVFTDGGTTHTYDKEEESLSLEAGYRFGNRSRLRVGYEVNEIERGTVNNSEDYTDSLDEDRAWAEYRLPRLGKLQAKLKAEWVDRDADLSSERLNHLGAFNDDDAAPGPSQVSEAALPYHLSGGDDESYSINLDYSAMDNLILSAAYTTTQRDFDNEAFGIKERDIDTLSLTASWMISDKASASVYYVSETYEQEQDGRQSSDGAYDANDELWELDQDDDNYTLGLGINWLCLDDTMEITADFSYHESNSEYDNQITQDLDGDKSPTYAETPTISTDIHRIDVAANYQFNDQWLIKTQYIYEYYRTDDWAWDGEVASPMNFNYEEPDHDAHALVISTRYQF